MVFCPKWVQIPLFTSLAFFFIGLMITGLVFPTAIEKVQTGGIKTEVQYNPSTMSTSSLNTYYNTTTNITYYVFNLTNYKAVLMNGSLPQYAEVGPIRLVKYRYRVDVDWSDSTEASYKYIELYDLPIGDPAWESIKTAPIINPNPLFWGALAQVGETVSSSSVPMGIGTPGPNLAESNLCAALTEGFAEQLFPTLQMDFNNAAGPLLTAFRFVAVPIYFNLVFSALAGAGITPLQAQEHWGAGPQQTAYSQNAAFGPGAVEFTGFELLTALEGSSADITTKVSALFSTSNPVSLVFTGETPSPLPASGIDLWLAFANVAQSVPFDTITFTQLASVLTTGNGITLNDATNILMWIGALTQANNPIYFGFIQKFLTTFLSWTPYSSNQASHAAPSPGFNLTSWEDVGRVQFGTGIISTIVTAASHPGNSTIGYTPDMNGNIVSVGDHLALGVPSSVFDLFPSFAPNPANPLPYEWYTAISNYANQYPSARYYSNSVPFDGEFHYPDNVGGYRSILDKHEVNTFLTTMSSGGVPIVTALLSALSAASSEYVGFSTFANNFAPNLVGLESLFPYTFTPPSPLPTAGLNRYLDLNNWFLGYICNSTAQSTFYGAYWPKGPGEADELGDDGISKVGGNNGLFRRKAVYETLFGYHDPVIGQDVPGLVGLLNVDVRNYGASGLPGAENAYSEQQLIDNYRASMGNNENTIMTTGRDDVNRVGQYIKYNGIAVLSDYCSLIDPSRDTVCASSAVSAAKQNALYRIWGKDESITGSTDGSAYPPFESSPPTPLSLYVEQVRRNAWLVYQSDVQFKGIFLHHYELDTRILTWDVYVDPVTGAQSPADNIYRNLDYRMHPRFVPNGLVHVTSGYGGVPIVVSKPHFLGGDELEFSKVGGMHPNEAIHETYLEIEPQTGLTMHLAKRLQAAFLGDYYTNSSFIFKDENGDTVNPQFDFTFTGYFKNVFPKTPGNPAFPTTQTYFPYYWADEDAEVSDSDASSFKSEIYDLWTLGRMLRILFSIVGGVFGILFSFLAIRACKAPSPKNTGAY